MPRPRRLRLTVIIGVLVMLSTTGNAFAAGCVLTAKAIPLVS